MKVKHWQIESYERANKKEQDTLFDFNYYQTKHMDVNRLVSKSEIGVLKEKGLGAASWIVNCSNFIHYYSFDPQSLHR